MIHGYSAITINLVLTYAICLVHIVMGEDGSIDQFLVVCHIGLLVSECLFTENHIVAQYSVVS